MLQYKLLYSSLDITCTIDVAFLQCCIVLCCVRFCHILLFYSVLCCLSDFCFVLYIVESCHALLCCVVLFPSSVQGLLQHGGPAGWASGGVPGSGLPAARHHPARTPPRTRLLARTVQVTTVSPTSSEPRQDGPGLLRDHPVEEHRDGDGGPVRQVLIEQTS